MTYQNSPLLFLNSGTWQAIFYMSICNQTIPVDANIFNLILKLFITGFITWKSKPVGAMGSWKLQVTRVMNMEAIENIGQGWHEVQKQAEPWRAGRPHGTGHENLSQSVGSWTYIRHKGMKVRAGGPHGTAGTQKSKSVGGVIKLTSHKGNEYESYWKYRSRMTWISKAVRAMESRRNTWNRT